MTADGLAQWLDRCVQLRGTPHPALAVAVPVRQPPAMTTFGTRARALLILSSSTSCWALGAGCSDSDDRPDYEINVDAGQQTPVSALDDDQLRDVCGSYSTYVETEISFDVIAQALCLVRAQLTTLSPDACEEAYTECLADAPSPVSIRAEIESGTLCTSALSQCRATVAQLEGCVNVKLDALVQVLDLLACPGASAETRDMAADLMTGVSACADVDARCTDFTQPVDLI